MNTPAPKASRALRNEIREAGDKKILQIVALLDSASENQFSQSVLEPLRPRLAALKPVRPLRFSRLLATPLDDLIVPAAIWRPGQAAIPRSVLRAMTSIVRAELGTKVVTIDRMIAGHDTESAEAITRAGRALWGRASDIVLAAGEHAEWGSSGLRPNAYGPLVRAIATVLRKADALRTLFRNAEHELLETDEQAIREIVADLSGASPEGGAMVFKLLLARLPHAISLLRPLVDQSHTTADKNLLQAAMVRGTDDLLNDMEGRPDLAQGLEDGPLAAVGAEVQRIAGLLQDLDVDPNSARHRGRVHGLRAKLGEICRGRFAQGMKAGIVEPLSAATTPVGSEDQQELETSARDLRTIEKTGRKLGNPAGYDVMLSKATETVQAAVHSGTISTVRAVRLVEISSGPDAAEQIYREASRVA